MTISVGFKGSHDIHVLTFSWRGYDHDIWESMMHVNVKTFIAMGDIV